MFAMLATRASAKEETVPMPNAPEQFKGAPHSVPGATGGLTAVTATENTREGVFDAMQRREAYATTGTTSVSSLSAAQTQHYVKGRNLAEIGYGKGVPMGGDHAKAPDGKAATFLLYAMRDPVGANLDRIQVVKGWLDADGSLKERIYDVAVSDGREIGEDGRCRQAVGNTVNIRPPASPTQSARLCSRPIGRTLTSIRRSGPSTM
jgi:hypothetical protein